MRSFKNLCGCFHAKTRFGIGVPLGKNGQNVLYPAVVQFMSIQKGGPQIPVENTVEHINILASVMTTSKLVLEVRLHMF